MILKNTNVGPNSCTYLDLYISIYRGKYNFKSYDKRRDFNFNVISYPHLISNIPKNPAYGVFTSQLVRFCRININASYFCRDIKLLVKKFIDQGFDKNALIDKYRSFAIKYLGEWAKFGENITSPTCIRNIFGRQY